MARRIWNPGGIALIVVYPEDAIEQASEPMLPGSKKLIALIERLKEAGIHYRTKIPPAEPKPERPRRFIIVAKNGKESMRSPAMFEGSSPYNKRIKSLKKAGTPFHLEEVHSRRPR